jgi:hypothetical protein
VNEKSFSLATVFRLTRKINIELKKMKKEMYKMPAIKMLVADSSNLLDGTVTKVDGGDSGISLGGGGNGPAFAGEDNTWEDEQPRNVNVWDE